MSDQTSETHGQADAWHRHTSDEGGPQTEDGAHASSKALGLTLLAIVFGVAAVIIVLVIYFNSYQSRYKAMRQEGTTSAIDAINAKTDGLAHLSSYGWIDREGGVAFVPVTDAADLVLAEYQEMQSMVPTTTDLALTSD